jgi:hypothetical protein
MSAFEDGAEENMVYLPADSPFYPGHIVMALANYAFPDPARLLVIRPDGQVVEEIRVQNPGGLGYICGVAYRHPDRFLVTGCSNRIWSVDFSGAVDPDPADIPEAGNIEGMVQVRDGRVVAADYHEAILHFFDQDLARLPEGDQDWGIGMGLGRPWGMAWDPFDDEFIFNSYGGLIVTVPPSVDSYEVLLDPPGFGYTTVTDIEFLAGSGQLVLGNRWNPTVVGVFDGTGALVHEVDLNWLGRIDGVAYLPDTEEFVVTRATDGFGILYVVGADGALHLEIDLSPAVEASLYQVNYFHTGEPGGDRLAVSIFPGRLLITDLDGNVLRDEEVGGVSAVPIRSGPFSGAFAAATAEPTELIVFTLD